MKAKLKDFPIVGWLSGLGIVGFLFCGIFAPWIANNAPGNVHELREALAPILKHSSDAAIPLTEEARKSSRQIRLLLLDLSVNYDEKREGNPEEKLKELISRLDKETEGLRGQKSAAIQEILDSVEQLKELIHKRQDHLFPIFSVGPDMPSPDQREILDAPSAVHPFGTDQAGRDVFARLIHGTRNAIFFSIAVVVLCLVIGTLLGGVMGFFGGKIDLILARIMEVIGNFPIFLLQLTFLAYLERPSYGILLVVMCFSGWIPYARFVRAEFLKLREQEFVQAARVIGASTPRIFFRHLMPNSLTPVMTLIPFDLSSTIIALGALSFIGFGEPIDTPSIGELLRQAQRVFQTAWWLALFPGLVLFLLTLSLTLFGQALRDHLDPRFAAKK